MLTVRTTFLVVLTASGLMLLVSCGHSSSRDAARDRDCIPRSVLRLTMAAWKGNVKEMRAAIDAGADVNASDSLTGTPLTGAAFSGSYEAVKLLVDKGANVNATDNNGYTPLMNAVLSGNVDIVRLLLSNGANVNASAYPPINGKRTDKFTALILAKGKKNEAIIKLLEEAGAKE
jgi:ankyrin repeat protein